MVLSSAQTDVTVCNFVSRKPFALLSFTRLDKITSRGSRLLCLIMPSSNKGLIQFLHNCFVFKDGQGVNSTVGKRGTYFNSPWKALPIKESMQPLKASTTRSNPSQCPTLNQFLNCATEEQFTNPQGDDSGCKIDEAAELPHAHLIHPALFASCLRFECSL